MRSYLTVRELIEFLSGMNQDAIVLACDDGVGEYGHEITAVGFDEGQHVLLHFKPD